MAEYIDKELLLGSVMRIGSSTGIAELYAEDVLNLIRDFPEADVAPVRHGEWVVQTCEGVSAIFQCSECGRTVEVSNDYFGAPTKHTAKTYPYCHCGARMDGGADNGE